MTTVKRNRRRPHLRHVVLDGLDHDAVLQVRRAAGHLHAPRRRHERVRHVAVAADLVAARCSKLLFTTEEPDAMLACCRCDAVFPQPTEELGAATTNIS